MSSVGYTLLVILMWVLWLAGTVFAVWDCIRRFRGTRRVVLLVLGVVVLIALPFIATIVYLLLWAFVFRKRWPIPPKAAPSAS